ncbi:hypothetical protein B0O80DRAFT_464991 [Mortierella sp. GBAus27b]|nr:hypothetical protein B0O80DRAFT_464991 [Mortierella sp. GBAus27b]
MALITACTSDVISMQEAQDTAIVQAFGAHLERVDNQLRESAALREQSVQLQRESNSNQQRMIQMQEDNAREFIGKTEEAAERLRKLEIQIAEGQMKLQKMLLEESEVNQRQHDEKMRLQRETLSVLSVMQREHRALLTQTYEMHEYTIPRLFIVVPKVVGPQDWGTRPSTDQYQLFFLCECDENAMLEGSKTPPEIHLAHHSGYDLDRPNEFFEKYGGYLLRIMEMVMFGVNDVAGMVVPPLSTLKIFNTLDITQQPYADLRKNIHILVNAVVVTLKSRSGNNGSTDTNLDDPDHGMLEALAGADLRQVENFLKDRDKDRFLGNLYRNVTPQGHVKWVCYKHYLSGRQQNAVLALKDMVEIVYGGSFCQEQSRIEIKLEANSDAKRFYDAMIKVRGIQELDFTFAWKVIMADLESLANAVTKANVIRLSVNGCHFKWPKELIVRGRRYDNLAKILFNGRIQDFTINQSEEFFSRIDVSQMAQAPKLRNVTAEWDLPERKKAVKAFHSFVKLCTMKTRIELKIRRAQSLGKATSSLFGRAFDTKDVVENNQSYIITVALGDIQEVVLTDSAGGRLVLPKTCYNFSDYAQKSTHSNPSTDTVSTHSETQSNSTLDPRERVPLSSWSPAARGGS